MFQIGFGECVVVCVVALWVLGPERLPAVARVCGRYIAKLKNTAQDIKHAFDEEMKPKDGA